jgi:Transposase DDE domain group 1
MREQYEQSVVKQRWVDEFSYAAQSWPHERRVIARLEWGEQGCNPQLDV